MPAGSMSRNAVMGEITMSLPWFNRSAHDAEIREAEAETAGIDAEYQKMWSAIGREVREAVIELEAARKTAELYRDTLQPQAASTLRATVAAYQTDQTEFLNLLDSQGMTIDFQHSMFQAIEEYEKTLVKLESAIGRPL